MATTLFMVFSLWLHLIAIGGLTYISMLLDQGNLLRAVGASLTTAFCILAVAWALAKAKAWLGD